MAAAIAPMISKLSKLKAAWNSGNRIEALRIAAKFGDLGEHKERISRAWAAHQNEQFYRELGQEPAALVEDGFKALAERYSLEWTD